MLLTSGDLQTATRASALTSHSLTPGARKLNVPFVRGVSHLGSREKLQRDGGLRLLRRHRPGQQGAEEAIDLGEDLPLVLCLIDRFT